MIYIQRTYVALMLLIIIVLTGVVHGAYAQGRTIQVVTKTITKELTYEKGDVLKISAEKSNVEITGWDKNYIQLTLKLTAKHHKREVAEEDLKYLKYEIKKEDLGHEISNFFQPQKNNTKVRSNLQAKYILKVPKSISLDTRNLYGEIAIRHTKGDARLQLNFGQLILENVEGALDIYSSYGDIIGNDLNITMKCHAEKANILLTKAMGVYNFESSYGKVELEASNGIKFFSVKGKNTEVSLSLLNFGEYGFNISTTYGNIKVPEKYTDFIKSSLTQKKEFHKEFNTNNKQILIHTTFSDITIQSYNAISKK